MKYIKILKNNLNQILAIAEKNIFLQLRFKIGFVMSLVSPLLQILLPLIILGQFFRLDQTFGDWNRKTFLLYLFIGYNIILSKKVITTISGQFQLEKYWNTIPGLMVAPFNKFNLLFGIVLSHIFVIAVPLFVFFSLCLFIYPISISTAIIFFIFFFTILVIFSGLGLIQGVLMISKENVGKAFSTFTDIFFWFSCITYPFDMFPSIIQSIINLNPIYHIIDLLRLTWAEDSIFLTLVNYPTKFGFILLLMILIPSLGVFSFNYLFKKYGIVGY